MTRYRLSAAVVCLFLLVTLAAWLQPRLPVDDTTWRRDYDVQFKKHAKHYFGAGTDWRWFRAQGIVESGLRPLSRSGRGARGIMQLMPSTFAEVWQANRLTPDIEEPRWNIAAGIAYDRYLHDRWAPRVPGSEQFRFMLASYNAGYTGVSRAVGRARSAGADGSDWQEVARFAPDETRDYVSKIRLLMGNSG